MVVVDNASFKDEATEIEKRYPHVIVVRSEKNLGFAGGNNLGVKASHGKYLFFINNDTLVCKDEVNQKRDYYFQSLVERLEKAPEIGAVCPKIRFSWDNKPIQFAGYTPLSSITLRNRLVGFGEEDSGQYDTAMPTPYAHGAAMMVKREVVERVGYMPECYFLYYEELDWSVLIRRSGYEIWYDPSCTVYHKESRTTGQCSPLRTYYITRNRLLFAQRNIPTIRRYVTYAYLIGIVTLRDILKHIVNRRKDLIRANLLALSDFFKGNFNCRNI